MKKERLKLINLLIVLILVLIAFMPKANAELDFNKTEGSLKITKYEVGDKGQLHLKGVTFDIYKVNDDETSTVIPTDDSILATKQSKTTDENGVATFLNLPLGRYLVVESNAPANVVSKISNFLVDIPMTSTDGTSLIYDVEVSPKNNTVYGGIVLQKVDSESNEGLSDVEFELQVLNGETWTKYGEILETADGTTDLDATGNILEKGKIEVSGLPAGTYRFIEKTTLDGYILDNKTTYEFNVSLGDDGTTIVDKNLIIVKNEKPTLNKEITSTLIDESVSLGETVSYKIETLIPSVVDQLVTYKLKETIDSGLDYTKDSLKIVAINSNGTEQELTFGTDYVLSMSLDEKILEIVFTENGKLVLSSNKRLMVTYDAVLNNDATIMGNNTNTELVYSAIVEKDYTGTVNTETKDALTADAKVYTGGIYIKKVDNENNVIPTGATFKIAVSQQAAKDGDYIDGIELTTDSNGLVSYKGLAYGKYWLVETKAPTYDVVNSEGKTVKKSYNLLKNPIEITVNSATYAENAAIEIINKKGFELPATGAIGSVIVSCIGVVVIMIGIKFLKVEEEK